uniref:Rab3-GAP regulatory subunit N-terminal domain-containing protein n=1 Tax=Tetradesmus obliquus TaxID=3088 RepID=A0A383W6M0_TETOB|eukprot:jgi/Sobl393_1/7360/SZX72664.1
MMRLPLEQGAGLALGLDAWLNGSTIPLAVAAHPSGVLLALARGSVLAVMPLLPGNSTCTAAQAAAEAAAAIAEACSIHHAQHQFTALAWFAQLRPARAVSSARNSPSPNQQQQQYQQPGASPHQQQAQQGAAHTSQQQQQQVHSSQQQWQQQPRCSLEAAEALLEPAVLLSGTADGHLQIHSAEGQLLFQQRFAATPVLDILVRPHCSGLRSSDAGEEVCVAYSNALVRINTLDLRSQVRMLQLAQGGGAAAAAGIAPLPHTRYELPATVGPRVSGLSFGLLPPDLYSLLSSAASSSSGGAGGSRSHGKHKICIVTVGRGPCLAAFEAEERPSRSTLAALVGMASSLTSGVVGAASKAAGFGPSMMYHGVKSLMKLPLTTWYSSSSSSTSSSTHSLLTSLPQPVVSFEDLQQLPKPEAMILAKQLRDDDRVLEGLVPAPAGTLLVAPDSLGRVLLVDGASMAAVRIWKGYRDAQCGWLLPPPSHPAARLGLLLVLFAPKRQTLEIWLPRSGQRLASRAVQYPCLLVPVGLPCGGWGNGPAWQAWQKCCGSATMLVMNVQSGEVWDAMECLLKE